MAVTFDREDAKRVRDVGEELMSVLTAGRNAQLDAALAAYACIECARVMLAAYQPLSRTKLLAILVPYLERGEAPAGMEGAKL